MSVRGVCGTGARIAAVALAANFAATVSGCSYLKWRQARSEGLSELQKHPSLLLEKEVLPENCFVLAGEPDWGPGEQPQLLAAAFDHTGTAHELVGSREVVPATGAYGMLLPAGTYDLLYFADLDHNGYYETHEVVGRSAPDAPVRVAAAEAGDDLIVPAPAVPIDLEAPRSSAMKIRRKVDSKPFVVESVAAPIFAPELGELGVYDPIRFLARIQGVAFPVGVPDKKKTQVILVHGINGTPRDFAALVPSLDASRYQVWLFYYPSGLPLDNLGKILALVVAKIAARLPNDGQVAIVAHSMGGLVGRRAVNELCAKGRPEYLRFYASFDTPYGGVKEVEGAVKRGTELVASWVDVASGSPFLERLHARPWPEDLPFQLFFGWGLPDHHGPSPAGDGTIALSSQLDPRAQAVATGMSGYADTHVGILSDPAALRELSRLLDEATGVGSKSSDAPPGR
jgi:pimeloyl-ACP methyl ester carboxylesterase